MAVNGAHPGLDSQRMAARQALSAKDQVGTSDCHWQKEETTGGYEAVSEKFQRISVIQFRKLHLPFLSNSPRRVVWWRDLAILLTP